MRRYIQTIGLNLPRIYFDAPSLDVIDFAALLEAVVIKPSDGWDSKAQGNGDGDCGQGSASVDRGCHEARADPSCLICHILNLLARHGYSATDDDRGPALLWQISRFNRSAEDSFYASGKRHYTAGGRCRFPSSCRGVMPWGFTPMAVAWRNASLFSTVPKQHQ
jgi:hypothetical protein